ncbi:hypothetical protein DYB28_003330 [Aphanomyces astaci]|uniref:Uncharacterized protein n=1 Tax=Aphanomyces astaci TaxID=112090 RepID=A0A9X8E5K8_APHAT|nr:hypothetical protein DYB28_003330 [Aphanomyces astaci]
MYHSMLCLSSPTTLHIKTADPTHSATASADVPVSKLDILPPTQKSQSPSGMSSEGERTFVPIAGCAILTGDLLRTSSTQRHKFIPWTDTTSLKHRGGHPRYSNIHRVELRSLMALLNPVGTFAGDWIRAHQDSTSTTDPVLRAKQALLAEADSLATLAHQLLPHTDYAHHIIPDSWELRDHQDLPVTGATAPWLGAIYSRHDWHAAQSSKPDARRAIQPLRLNTGDLCKWDLPALSFYWRAICYTLHTNVRNTAFNHGELPLLTEVNNNIRLKRRYHDAAPMGHDRRIRARRAHLTAKTLRWHSRRLSLLLPAIPPPIGYADPTLRPP